MSASRAGPPRPDEWIATACSQAGDGARCGLRDSSAVPQTQVNILRSRSIIAVHAVSGPAICRRERGCTDLLYLVEDVRAGESGIKPRQARGSMRPPKLLFDTNVFYACVDISPRRQHPDSAAATRLLELLNRCGGEAWLTPATGRDIDRTSSSELRRASKLRMRQWPTLDPLTVPPRLLDEARYQQPVRDNDEVDAHMLAALDAEAVDFLITQDRALRRHAAHAGLGDRTMTIQDGIEVLERLLGEPTQFPTVRPCLAYGLPAADPLFESLRDGDSGFDAWFQRARRGTPPLLRNRRRVRPRCGGDLEDRDRPASRDSRNGAQDLHLRSRRPCGRSEAGRTPVEVGSRLRSRRRTRTGSTSRSTRSTTVWCPYSSVSASSTAGCALIAARPSSARIDDRQLLMPNSIRSSTTADSALRPCSCAAPSLCRSSHAGMTRSSLRLVRSPSCSRRSRRATRC